MRRRWSTKQCVWLGPRGHLCSRSRQRLANANTHSDSNGNCDGDDNCDADSYRHSNSYAYTITYANRNS
jgi:hypothetical protein